MNQVLVSIITPCFNSAQFIRECIESVLAQDYPYIEFVIQDGASRDGTKEIITGYAIRHEHIHFVSEPDRGQSDGLNKAIQRSQGDILIVLNADDALLPHACSWAAEHLARHPEAGAIYGDEYIMNEHGTTIEEFCAPEYDFKKVLTLEIVPPAQASFIRRSALEAVGFYADNTLDSCPDFEMWVRLGLHFPIIHVPGFVSRYRHLGGELYEGGVAKTASRFFNAKLLIQKRLFDSPRTNPELRSLKERAYSGLLMWCAAAHFGINSTFRGIIMNPFLYRALWEAFRKGYWRWFLGNIGRYSKLLIQRLINGRY